MYYRMRNTRTGEVRDVEVPSPEAAALDNEVLDDGKGRMVAAWETIGRGPSRATDKSIHANDLSKVTPDKHPERSLSEAEVAAGLTSWEEKQAQLKRKSSQTTVKPPVQGRDEELKEDSDEKRPGDMTIPELKRYLTARGIEFGSKASKGDLLELLLGSPEDEPEESSDNDKPDVELDSTLGDDHQGAE